ncbi:MAG: hypothetical protein R6W70_01490, partial [bacterium]
MIEFVEKGGFMMYPILFSSIIVFAVAVERLMVFSRVKLPGKNKIKEIHKMLIEGKIDELKEFLELEK